MELVRKCANCGFIPNSRECRQCPRCGLHMKSEIQRAYDFATLSLSMRTQQPKSRLWRMRAKQALKRLEKVHSEAVIKPSLGFVFLTAVDEIPQEPKNQGGFGIETKKKGPETPYRFKVMAVGGPRPFEGILISSPVQYGDVISLLQSNANLREQYHESGFVVGDMHFIVADFRDILGAWE